MKILLPLCLVIISLSGCANRNKVIVDTQGVDMAQYQYDLYQCQQYAEQVEPKTGGSAAGGAIVGGLIGAAIGNSDTAKKGAGVGAIKGAVVGNAKTKKEKQRVVRNCLLGRGYRVLN